MSHHAAAQTAAEAWFLRHGLPYFVPSERAAAQAALRPRKIVPLLLLLVPVALAPGAASAWLSEDFALAPAILVSLSVVAAASYGLTALRARPIVGWALGRALASLRMLLPMVTRALPLLLLFITFLFINAEVWEVAANLGVGVLWLTVLLFTLMGVGFLLVRLPEEVDRADDAVDDRVLLTAVRGTPLEAVGRELVDDPLSDPASHATVTGYERWNLILVLVVVQSVQVLVLVVAVFVFLLVFGALVMSDTVVQSWIGGPTHSVPGLPNVSAELAQVSLFLASFSGLYFTVSAITDETYRDQFFSNVMQEMERAVGVRAVYLALCHRQSP